MPICRQEDGRLAIPLGQWTETYPADSLSSASLTAMSSPPIAAMTLPSIIFVKMWEA